MTSDSQPEHIQTVRKALTAWDNFQAFLLTQGLTWKQAQEIIANFESGRSSQPKEDIVQSLSRLAQMHQELERQVLPTDARTAENPRPMRFIRRL